MAKRIKAGKGFTVIALTRAEAEKVGIGFHTNFRGFGIYHCLDDETLKEIKGIIFYVPVLNRCFTKTTCRKFVNNHTPYPEDKEYEDSKSDLLMLKLERLA